MTEQEIWKLIAEGIAGPEEPTLLSIEEELKKLQERIEELAS